MPALFRSPSSPIPRALRRAATGLAIAAMLVGAASCGSQAATPSPSAVLAAIAPATDPPSGTPSPSPDPTASPTDSPVPTDSPSPSPTPTTGRAVATRVVIAKLGIDLAVVKAPSGYPYCNVAMYFGKPFLQPGEPGPSYIFAHARTGMFGPIYQLVMFKRTPNVMVGMLVDVYTSDDMVHTYRIARVYVHQLSLKRPLSATSDQLWLQTSEGPHGTPGKTQILATPVSTAPADHAAANPKPHIVVCG
jgi:hypothetical protein